MSIDQKFLDSIRTSTCHHVLSFFEPLSDTDCQALGDALASNTNIEYLSLSSCQLSDTGLTLIMHGLRQHPTVDHLVINGQQNYGNAGFSALAEALSYNDHIRTVFYDANAEGVEKFLEVLGRSGNKTAQKFLVDNGKITAYPQGKMHDIYARHYAYPVIKQMQRATPDFDAIAISDLCGAAAYSEHLLHNGTLNEKDTQALSAAFAKLPTYKTTLPSLRMLFTTHKASGNLTLLDNGFIWREMPTLVAHLAKLGTPLTKEHLMQPNRDGDPYLLNSVISTSFKRTLNLLHSIGAEISVDDLVQENGTATTLLNVIAAQNEARALFTPEIWKHQGSRAMQRVYQALPEDTKPQIPNYHTMLQEMRRAEQGANPVKGRG